VGASCTPHDIAAGSGFVDDGGDVHVVRNEGGVDAVVYVTSLVPQAPRGGSTSRVPATAVLSGGRWRGGRPPLHPTMRMSGDGRPE
jgi:hypothetical protein